MSTTKPLIRDETLRETIRDILAPGKSFSPTALLRVCRYYYPEKRIERKQFTELLGWLIEEKLVSSRPYGHGRKVSAP